MTTNPTRNAPPVRVIAVHLFTLVFRNVRRCYEPNHQPPRLALMALIILILLRATNCLCHTFCLLYALLPSTSAEPLYFRAELMGRRWRKVRNQSTNIYCRWKRTIIIGWQAFGGLNDRRKGRKKRGGGCAAMDTRVQSYTHMCCVWLLVIVKRGSMDMGV